MVHQMKLSYFPVRGYGEPARLMLIHAGVKFEDHVVQLADWAALKPTTPFGQLPVLELPNGIQIAQSLSIYKYIGSEYGFAGVNTTEAALISSIAEFVKEFDTKTGNYFRMEIGFLQGDKKAEYENVVKPAIALFFPVFTKWIRESGSGYLTRNLSYADFFAADKLSNVVSMCEKAAITWPEITAYVNRIYNLPSIKEHIAHRPKSIY
uniref:Glutathione S-transferase n=1 Tax=Rhabditophanes sp. KR3021 TaxID=114890 RepID=A0AC35UBB2_9BILA